MILRPRKPSSQVIPAANPKVYLKLPSLNEISRIKVKVVISNKVILPSIDALNSNITNDQPEETKPDKQENNNELLISPQDTMNKEIQIIPEQNSNEFPENNMEQEQMNTNIANYEHDHPQECNSFLKQEKFM